MKRRQQIKMFWRRLRGEDNKLKILMLDVGDEDFVENMNDCLQALQSNIYPILIPSGSSGIFKFEVFYVFTYIHIFFFICFLIVRLRTYFNFF